MNIQGLMRAARTNLPILVLEGGYVCLLEELSWNSDARRKGEAAVPAQAFNPTSQLPAPRSFEGVSDRLAVAQAADKRWRGDRTKEVGNWRPTTPVPQSSQGREPPLRQSGVQRARGSSSGRAEPCYKHAAFSLAW